MPLWRGRPARGASRSARPARPRCPCRLCWRGGASHLAFAQRRPSGARVGVAVALGCRARGRGFLVVRLLLLRRASWVAERQGAAAVLLLGGRWRLSHQRGRRPPFAWEDSSAALGALGRPGAPAAAADRDLCGANAPSAGAGPLPAGHRGCGSRRRLRRAAVVVSPSVWGLLARPKCAHQLPRRAGADMDGTGLSGLWGFLMHAHVWLWLALAACSSFSGSPPCRPQVACRSWARPWGLPS